MNPELTGFALGLLLGAAKVMTIAAAGFGLAWWRARRRIKQLEADQLEAERLSAPSGEELRQIGEGLAHVIVQLDQLNRAQAELMKQLSERTVDQPAELPPGRPRA